MRQKRGKKITCRTFQFVQWLHFHFSVKYPFKMSFNQCKTAAYFFKWLNRMNRHTVLAITGNKLSEWHLKDKADQSRESDAEVYDPNVTDIKPCAYFP